MGKSRANAQRLVWPGGIIVLMVGLLQCASAAQKELPKIDFNRDIRPIFSNNCYFCHGPDDAKRKAGLRFDMKEGAFGKSGVIVAGKSSESRLIQRISSTNPDKLMPPPEAGRTLTARQIELMRRWVDEGARWELHWAYVPPKRPELPVESHFLSKVLTTPLEGSGPFGIQVAEVVAANPGTKEDVCCFHPADDRFL